MEATLRRLRDRGMLADYEILEHPVGEGGSGREIRLIFPTAASAAARQETIEGVIVAAVAAGERVTITTATSPDPDPAPPATDGMAAPAAWWVRLLRRRKPKS